MINLIINSLAYKQLNVLYNQSNSYKDQVEHHSDCKDKDISPEFTTADGVALAVIIVLGCFILVGG